MALGIPLPGAPGQALIDGLGSGSSFMDRIVKNNQSQEQIKLNEMQQQRLAELQPYQIAQYQQAAAMAPFQQQLAQAQAEQARAKTALSTQDMNLMAQLMSQMPGFGGMDGGQQPQSVSMEGQESVNFTPMPGIQQPNMNGGMSMPNGQMHPALAEYFKKRTGLDPYAESPQMKDARDFDQFQKKEEFKQNIPKDQLTGTVQSQLQEESSRIAKLLPDLDELIEMDPQTLTWLGTNNDQAYENALFNLADGLVKAKGLPQTDSSIKKQLEALRIGGSELAPNYKKRLIKEKENLVNRYNKNMGMLGDNKVGSERKRERTYNPETGVVE